MSNPLRRPITREQAERALAAFKAHGENKEEAARSLGMTASSFKRHYRKAAEFANETPAIEFPVFPDDDLPVGQIVDHLAARFEKRKASFDAHTWFEVKIKENKPIGILWIGDPHLDDGGCNWPVLKRHVEICRTTEGLYGANIGDTTNNWAGRLVHLYAKQDASLKTAQKLASWFMLDSGVKWLVWLLGNHDKFGDGAGVLAQMAKRYGTKEIVCHDWEARFSISFPNKASFRIWAAHDFSGSSTWNPLHGPLKAAKLGQEAHLFVCGHKHNWGIFTYENADRGITQAMIRVRGYKSLDDHARKFTLAEQQGGCSIMTIFDPNAPAPLAFYDIEQGAEYLTWLRSRA